MHPGLGWNGDEILRPRHPLFKTARWQVKDSIWLFFWGRRDYAFRLPGSPESFPSKEANMSTAPGHQTEVQDPVKVDPKQYKVDLENYRVRVLRVTYGPREKSVMHSHPHGIAVFLTDQHSRFTLPDGKSEENRFIPGQ